MATYEELADQEVTRAEVTLAEQGGAYPDLIRLRVWICLVRGIVYALCEVSRAIRETGAR